MAITYSISPRLILIVMEGVVTDRNLLEAQHALFDDPDFDAAACWPRLVDASAVTNAKLSTTIVRHVAHCAVERGMRRAALIASSDLVYALMRMYEGYASEAECGVFRDRTDALTWLGMHTQAQTAPPPA